MSQRVSCNRLPSASMRGTAARSTAAHLFLSRGAAGGEARAASGAAASTSEADGGASSLARAAGTVLRAAVALGTLYVAYDLASDAVFYALCKREAEALMRDNEALRAALGEPLSFGPWWDASVTRARGGGVATAQFVLRGPAASADLRVGVVRSRAAEAHWAARSSGAHALASPADWRPLLAEVTMPGRGAHGRLDLLEPAAAAAARSAKHARLNEKKP